jgi:hypothetical protein
MTIDTGVGSESPYETGNAIYDSLNLKEILSALSEILKFLHNSPRLLQVDIHPDTFSAPV